MSSSKHEVGTGPQDSEQEAELLEYLDGSIGEESDEEENMEPRFSIYLPNAEPYHNLTQVYQDNSSERIDLSDESSDAMGLFSTGFVTCVGIIMRSSDGAKLSLLHVSTLNSTGATRAELIEAGASGIEVDPDRLIDEYNFITDDGKLGCSIELCISKENFVQETVPQDGLLPVDQYFAEKIAQTRNQLRRILGLEAAPEVHNLPCGLVLLTREGEVVNFDGYQKTQITIEEFFAEELEPRADQIEAGEVDQEQAGEVEQNLDAEEELLASHTGLGKLDKEGEKSTAPASSERQSTSGSISLLSFFPTDSATTRKRARDTEAEDVAHPLEHSQKPRFKEAEHDNGSKAELFQKESSSFNLTYR